MMECYDRKTNTLVARKNANISIPVSVKPKVNLKDAATYCCGDPVLKKQSCNCENTSRKGRCCFVLSQNVCIEIPIEISMDTILNEAYIDCSLIHEDDQ